MATADTVRSFYERILQRAGAEVSQGEIDYWTAAADSTGIDATRDAFVTSAEATQFVDPIVRLYQSAFNRLPDQAGLNFWVDHFRSGAVGSLRDIANGFTGSDEFRAIYGTSSTPTDDYIRALYRNVLGREPDDGGFQYWRDAAQQGFGNADLLLAFAESREFAERSAAAVDTFLRAAADGTTSYTGPLIPPSDDGGGADPVIVRASTTESGEQADGSSVSPVTSADGRFVAFSTTADNLMPGGTAGGSNVIVKDLATGEVTLASASASGTQGSGDSSSPSISADGRYVAFASTADNLIPSDANGAVSDIFVKDLATGQVTLVNASASGEQANSARDFDFVGSFSPSISADGRFVAFASTADNLVPGDTNRSFDVFLKDLATGSITRISTSAEGLQGNESSSAPVISADGTKVAFSSIAGNLVPNDISGNGETSFVADIYLKDLATGAITLVNTSATGEQAQGGVYSYSISGDGTKVAFSASDDVLVPNDTNGQRDIFVKDMVTGAVTLISASAEGELGNGSSSLPSISADGRYVAFASAATNLVPGDTTGGIAPSGGNFDIFVKDLLTGEITRATTSASGEEANDTSFGPSVSADGGEVAFYSSASNLVPGDTNAASDVFVRDLVWG